MIIAITGPTGAIGAELVTASLDQGHRVIAIINPGSKRRSNLPDSDRLKIIECDISNYGELTGKEHCDYFFHLAWKSSGVANRDDVYSQIDNIRYTIDAVNMAYSWGASVFIGAGSQAEYGPPKDILKEDTGCNPESGYGIAKYSAGQMCKLHCKKNGMRCCWTRILSVFGRFDMDHTLIMYLIKSFLNNDVPHLTKCEQIWDYLYAKDAANALLKVGEKGKDGQTYLIANGHTKKLKDYVTIVRDQIDPTLRIGFGDKDYYPHQPMILAADVEKLKNDTGFEPEYSFEDGIRETIDYVKNRVMMK